MAQACQRPLRAPGFKDGPGTTGAYVDVTSTATATTHANFTVTWTLDKSVVRTITDNGAAKYQVCLGAVHLDDYSNTAPGFPTSTGGTATPVVSAFPNPNGTVNGSPFVWYYWGLLPACTSKTPTNPCILPRQKKNGSLVISYVVQYPVGSGHPHLGP